MNKNQGVIAGALGCVFAVLGIFTLGIVFVPIAALCSLVGLVRGLTSPSVSGIGISLLAGVLTFAGFATSPALLLATGGGIIASQVASAPIHQPTVQRQAPAMPQPVQQQAQRAPMNAADAIKIASKEAEMAIMECRAKRLSGELKTYVASAQCSNPRVIQAFSKANYRYMDLISLLNAKRAVIAEKMDRHELTEIEGQAEYTKSYSEIVGAEQRRERGGR